MMPGSLPQRLLWEGRRASCLGLRVDRPGNDARALEGEIEAALEAGVSLLDVELDGGAAAVGRVLAGLEPLRRAALTVSCRLGFAPWPAPSARDATKPPLAVERHSLVPTFLAWSLDRALAELGLERIDLACIHAPETQRRLVDEASVHAQLARAFERLEGQVEAGRLGAYGIATWSALTSPPGHPEHLELARVVDAAERAGGAGHHLRVVQLPFGRELSSAATQTLPGGERVTALGAAEALGLRMVLELPGLEQASDAALMEALALAETSPIGCALVRPGRRHELERLLGLMLSGQRTGGA
jgi:hypothetical protein